MKVFLDSFDHSPGKPSDWPVWKDPCPDIPHLENEVFRGKQGKFTGVMAISIGTNGRPKVELHGTGPISMTLRRDSVLIHSDHDYEIKRYTKP